jgi:F-type H+-transporting ATPase subunit k
VIPSVEEENRDAEGGQISSIGYEGRDWGAIGVYRGDWRIVADEIFDGQLSIATLSITFGGAALAMGGKKVEKTTTPPLNAKNNDEEKFIK